MSIEQMQLCGETQQSALQLLPVLNVELLERERNLDYLQMLTNALERTLFTPAWYEHEHADNKLKVLQLYQLSINYANNSAATLHSLTEELSARVTLKRREVLSKKQEIRDQKKGIDELKVEHRGRRLAFETQKRDLAQRKLEKKMEEDLRRQPHGQHYFDYRYPQALPHGYPYPYPYRQEYPRPYQQGHPYPQEHSAPPSPNGQVYQPPHSKPQSSPVAMSDSSQPQSVSPHNTPTLSRDEKQSAPQSPDKQASEPRQSGPPKTRVSINVPPSSSEIPSISLVKGAATKPALPRSSPKVDPQSDFKVDSQTDSKMDSSMPSEKPSAASKFKMRASLTGNLGSSQSVSSRMEEKDLDSIANIRLTAQSRAELPGKTPRPLELTQPEQASPAADLRRSNFLGQQHEGGLKLGLKRVSQDPLEQSITLPQPTNASKELYLSEAGNNSPGIPLGLKRKGGHETVKESIVTAEHEKMDSKKARIQQNKEEEEEEEEEEERSQTQQKVKKEQQQKSRREREQREREQREREQREEKVRKQKQKQEAEVKERKGLKQEQEEREIEFENDYKLKEESTFQQKPRDVGKKEEESAFKRSQLVKIQSGSEGSQDDKYQEDFEQQMVLSVSSKRGEKQCRFVLLPQSEFKRRAVQLGQQSGEDICGDIFGDNFEIPIDSHIAQRPLVQQRLSPIPVPTIPEDQDQEEAPGSDSPNLYVLPQEQILVTIQSQGKSKEEEQQHLTQQPQSRTPFRPPSKQEEPPLPSKPSAKFETMELTQSIAVEQPNRKDSDDPLQIEEQLQEGEVPSRQHSAFQQQIHELLRKQEAVLNKPAPSLSSNAADEVEKLIKETIHIQIKKVGGSQDWLSLKEIFRQKIKTLRANQDSAISRIPKLDKVINTEEDDLLYSMSYLKENSTFMLPKLAKQEEPTESKGSKYARTKSSPKNRGVGNMNKLSEGLRFDVDDSLTSNCSSMQKGQGTSLATLSKQKKMTFDIS